MSRDGGEKSSAETSSTPKDTVATSSGHTKCRMFRFSGTLASIFTGLGVVTPAKDYYLEKFGAHPLAMGFLFFIVSFLTPVGEMFSGRLQSREALRAFFPVARWGRKAPWLLTHCIILAIACALMFIPPEANAILLHAWFFVLSVTMFFSCSTMTIAFEAARQEIYPYNEERSSVELFCKISATSGMGISILPMLVLLANAAFILRLMASILWSIGVLVVGMQASSIWLEANSMSKETDEAQSMRSLLKEMWRSPVLWHLCMVRWWEGMYQGIQATNLVYYITYVLQMHGVGRSMFIGMVGVFAVMGEMPSAGFVTRWLKELILFGYKILDDDQDLLVVRGLFLLWMTATRVFQSPYTFWRVAAQCWAIDEDIHHAGPGGVRREAAIVGLASAWQNFARALSSAVVFLGYGIAGLKKNECMVTCADKVIQAGLINLINITDGTSWSEGTPFEMVINPENWSPLPDTTESEEDCLDSCFDKAKIDQPESLRFYIRCCFVLGLTVTELFLIFHTRLFPIKGIRLAKLYNNQTIALGGTIDAGTASQHNAKLKRSKSQAMRHMVEASPGESKVMMMNYDVDAGIAQVNEMLERKKSSDRLKVSKGSLISKGSSNVSVSVVLTLPEFAMDNGKLLATNGIHLEPLPEATVEVSMNTTNNGATKGTSDKAEDGDSAACRNDEGFTEFRSHLDARAACRPRTPVAKLCMLGGDMMPASTASNEDDE